MTMVLQWSEHPCWLRAKAHRGFATSTEQDVLRAVAQVVAERKPRFTPRQDTARRIAPRFQDVVAVAQGGVSHPEPTVAIVGCDAFDGVTHVLDVFEGHEVVVLFSATLLTSLLDVPRWVGKQDIVFRTRCLR